AGGKGFNELDNWLEIMDVDPPHSMPEKRIMYERLLDILADTLEGNAAPPQAIDFVPLSKKQLHQEMRAMIER
ncbi:MAG: hypothetical protein ACREBQ_10470, partial [Nitrososphaerales archaeon]